MKRKTGCLIPLEVAILHAGIALHEQGVAEFYGFSLAREIKNHNLTAYGTLYRALDRMERVGLLSRRWEEPDIAEHERRPRRRLYRVTEIGTAALAKEMET